MSNFAEFLRADMRLVVLRILSEMPSYRANSSIISNLLTQMGHSATRDQVKTELRWLDEQGMLKLDEVGSVMVAVLTERGQDVSEGKGQVDGIARPRA